MGANDAAVRVREAMEQLKAQNVKERQLVDVLELSGVLTDAMGHFFSALDESIKDEFIDIAGFIKKARNEIGDLRPKDIQMNRIPSAGEELEAIVADTEVATDKIMQTAEDVLAIDPDSTEDFATQIQDKMLVIIEEPDHKLNKGMLIRRLPSVAHAMEEECVWPTEQRARKRELCEVGGAHP